MLIGITLIGIVAGAFGGASVPGLVAARLIENGVEQRLAQPLSIGVVVVVLAFLSLVVGELMPKRIALINPDGIASPVPPTIAVLARVAHPVVSFLQICTDAMLRLFGVRTLARAPVTDEELHALVGEGADQGSIDPAERHMVEQVLRLGDRPARTIKTRRRDIVWLDVRDSDEAVRRKVADNWPQPAAGLRADLGQLPRLRSCACAGRSTDRASNARSALVGREERRSGEG